MPFLFSDSIKNNILVRVLLIKVESAAKSAVVHDNIMGSTNNMKRFGEEITLSVKTKFSIARAIIKNPLFYFCCLSALILKQKRY
jgi:ABC-type multidrug transport system fused ATPase/permease subunit